MQAYVVENDIEIMWEYAMPGPDWVLSFQWRWRHKVKVKRPSDIKRSRAQVSPEIVQEFFTNFELNLAGVTAAHFLTRTSPGSKMTLELRMHFSLGIVILQAGPQQQQAGLFHYVLLLRRGDNATSEGSLPVWVWGHLLR